MSHTRELQWTGRVVCLLVVAAGCLHGASSASAAVYEVRACDAAGGANNSWGTSVNHGAMSAYTACPSSGDGKRGIMTRHAVGGAGAFAPGGAAARATFTAPAGTSIVGIRASYSFVREDPSWQVGLSNGSTVLRGCLPGGGSICVAAADNEQIGVPGGNVLYIETFCPAGACATSSSGNPGTGYVRARATIYAATVQISDPGAPGISVEGRGLWTDGWKRGRQELVMNAWDTTGISENRVYIDGNLVGRIGRPCDYTVPSPCPNGGDNFAVETGTSAQDGKHTVTVETVDAAGNNTSSSREVLIDNTPPSAPQDLAVENGDGWRASNDFAVTWGNPKDSGSSVAGVEYEICPAGGGDCKRGSATGDAMSRVAKLKVPEPGDWLLRVWLRDAAGNESRTTAAPPVHLRFDDQAPSAAFAPTDPNDPTRIAVDVKDSTSGLGSGAIELREQGASAWRPLDSRVERTELAASLDDEQLRDGVYEFRARALDRAGNERSTDQKADGSKQQLTLPLRLKTRLSAGAVQRRAGKRTVLRQRFRISYGRRARIRGRLVTAEGTPFADQELVVSQRLHQTGAAFTPLARIRTTKTGRFSYRASWGPARTLRFRYGGTKIIRPATREVRLHVPAMTTVRTGRRSFLNGEIMRFRGRLRGGRIPPGGKLVELQVRLRGRYRTFATTRANRSGRWEYRYRFDGTVGRQTYKFRVYVPREPTYPFRGGMSRQVRVSVRGV